MSTAKRLEVFVTVVLLSGAAASALLGCAIAIGYAVTTHNARSIAAGTFYVLLLATATWVIWRRPRRAGSPRRRHVVDVAIGILVINVLLSPFALLILAM